MAASRPNLDEMSRRIARNSCGSLSSGTQQGMCGVGAAMAPAWDSPQANSVKSWCSLRMAKALFQVFGEGVNGQAGDVIVGV